MSPVRVQRKRARGWKAPLCSCGCGKPARYVGRPGKWGNPYRKGADPAKAVALFIDMLARAPRASEWNDAFGRAGETVADTIQRQLRGHDLMCWCPLDQPCHADVLLDLANDEASA